MEVHFERKNTYIFEKDPFLYVFVFLKQSVPLVKEKHVEKCVFSAKNTNLQTKCLGEVKLDECFQAKCPGLWLAAERS